MIKKILFLSWLGMICNVHADDMQLRIVQEQIDNLAIHVGPLQAGTHIPLLDAPARVIVPSQHEILVSSPQAGLLSQLQFNIGDKVAKGQIIAQIISPELVALQQQFLTANSELLLATHEHRRDRQLLQEGVIAERRMQETQAHYAGKSAKTDEAKQLLMLAGMTPADIQQLAKNHRLDNRLSIRSPINGVVLERMATLGVRLDPQAPLYRLADLSELWLEIHVPQQRIEELHIGDPISNDDATLHGKITLLGQNVNTENQTVSVRARVESASSPLRVGQIINVHVQRDHPELAFKVPSTAIAQNMGHHYIFIRNDEGFKVTEVKVLGRQDENTVISSPNLTGQEHIALQGSVALKANWLGLGENE